MRQIGMLARGVCWMVLAAGCARDASEGDAPPSAGVSGAVLATAGSSAGGGASGTGGGGASGVPVAAGGTGGAAGTSASGAGSGGVDSGGASASAGSGTAIDAPIDTTALSALPECGATITTLFSKEAIDPPATLSGIFNAVTAERRAALEASIHNLVANDVAGAIAQASSAAYELCRTDDAGSLVAVWRPQVAGEGHVLAALRTQDARPLIVEAPHAFHDADTELEATEMFLALRARALVLSGTYRCASLQAGPCDGYTTACTGLPVPYTISDAAHNSEMLFQAAHVALADSFAQDIVASMHGMPDPGVSVSNGTPMSPAPGSFHARLVVELATALPAETITTCQDVANATTDKRWCGSENAQGRYLNGAADVCAENATATSDRFVHLEQSRAVRDQRAQIIAAFDAALG